MTPKQVKVFIIIFGGHKAKGLTISDRKRFPLFWIQWKVLLRSKGILDGPWGGQQCCRLSATNKVRMKTICFHWGQFDYLQTRIWSQDCSWVAESGWGISQVIFHEMGTCPKIYHREHSVHPGNWASKQCVSCLAYNNASRGSSSPRGTPASYTSPPTSPAPPPPEFLTLQVGRCNLETDDGQGSMKQWFVRSGPKTKLSTPNTFMKYRVFGPPLNLLSIGR